MFGERKNDHKIINAALKLRDDFPEHKVVLVTKDICLRVKAKSLNLHAEDYETGKVKDVDDLYTGKSSIEELDASIIDDLAQDRIIDYKRFQKTKALRQSILHANELHKIYSWILQSNDR